MNGPILLRYISLIIFYYIANRNVDHYENSNLEVVLIFNKECLQIYLQTLISLIYSVTTNHIIFNQGVTFIIFMSKAI